MHSSFLLKFQFESKKLNFPIYHTQEISLKKIKWTVHSSPETCQSHQSLNVAITGILYHRNDPLGQSWSRDSSGRKLNSSFEDICNLCFVQQNPGHNSALWCFGGALNTPLHRLYLLMRHLYHSLHKPHENVWSRHIALVLKHGAIIFPQSQNCW